MQDLCFMRRGSVQTRYETYILDKYDTVRFLLFATDSLT